jgi:hypothetical protein
MKKIFFNKTFIFTVLALILLGGLFYWFAYRPTQIRHDCSWVKRVNPSTPIQPAITKEDVEASKIKYNECINERKNRGDLFKGLFCDSLLKQERPIIFATPETYWYAKANQNEYNFCIHEKGLK